MIVIGLTGSIAMGKSTVAAFLAQAGAPVFDSDAAVHALYRGAEARRIEAEFPGVLRDGVVDRAALAAQVMNDSAALGRLEAIVHPLVEAARLEFLRGALADGRRQAVVDVPLLMEIGADRAADVVVLVSAPALVQKRRALARPGMTEQRFESIVARQLPDAEKRRRAHFVIETGGSLAATEAQALGMFRALAAMTGGM